MNPDDLAQALAEVKAQRRSMLLDLGVSLLPLLSTIAGIVALGRQARQLTNAAALAAPIEAAAAPAATPDELLLARIGSFLPAGRYLRHEDGHPVVIDEDGRLICSLTNFRQLAALDDGLLADWALNLS